MKKIFQKINRRLSLARYWLKNNLALEIINNRLPISMAMIIKTCLVIPCQLKAKFKIKKIKSLPNYLVVYFNNFSNPIYYPRNLSKKGLYQVIVESFDSNAWHYYEIDQTKVKSNDVVVDCGAAEGLFSILVANRCKQVYAIEPLPEFVKALKLTFEKFDNVKIMPMGLGSKEESGYITKEDINSAINFSGKGEKINITTIDKLFYDKNIPVNYIKADLEGFELEMLKGAQQTVKKYLPKFAITTYHHHSHALWIYNYLKQINPNYNIIFKGIEERAGMPVMIHAWIDE
ncbi:MAG: FkbM family methyltransferase [Patescibacteria group bacterium]